MTLQIDKFLSVRPTDSEAESLATFFDDESLISGAGALRDEGHANVMTYSPKVFIPLTILCRDVCHYCTFAKRPKDVERAYLHPDEVVEIARLGREAGCYEALFTLGDKPERRYRQAREELENLEHASTFDYLLDVTRRVFEDFGLLPHINAGILSNDQMAALREISASQGIMLESASERL